MAFVPRQILQVGTAINKSSVSNIQFSSRALSGNKSAALGSKRQRRHVGIISLHFCIGAITAKSLPDE
jgi:hypothetical protein